MVGPTAQIVGLTCYLKARRKGIVTGRFFPDNSTCTFCEFIEFSRRATGREKDSWELMARSPDEWMDGIMAREFSRVFLHHGSGNWPLISDRESAGFAGGGGRWTLCVEKEGRTDCWEASWEVGDRKAPDRRIWRVRYRLIGELTLLQPDKISSAELAARLMDNLTRIQTFAVKHGLDNFAGNFSSARRCLAGDDRMALESTRDLVPAGLLPAESLRLLAASQAGWVFGGMGSWNDLGFDGEEEQTYRKLSDELYELLNRAICVAVNVD